jgi:hypothetical protein
LVACVGHTPGTVANMTNSSSMRQTAVMSPYYINCCQRNPVRARGMAVSRSRH